MTLTFWLALLFNDGGIIFLGTPLNILGDKNVRELVDLLGITALNVASEDVSVVPRAGPFLSRHRPTERELLVVQVSGFMGSCIC